MKPRVSHKDYWEIVGAQKRPLDGDAWIHRYINKISEGPLRILDLGCGYGNETKYLLSAGHDVLSVDLSPSIIERMQLAVPNSNGIVFDMAEDDWGIFQTSQFDVVVASLSLHYFGELATVRIMDEVKRILKPDGKLYARVNSASDVAHGAGDGIMIEKNFYIDNKRGTTKRFFDENDVKRFFKPLGDIKFKEIQSTWNGKAKPVFEIVVVNKK